MFTFDESQILAILYILIPNKNEFEIFKILSIKKICSEKGLFYKYMQVFYSWADYYSKMKLVKTKVEP